MEEKQSTGMMLVNEFLDEEKLIAEYLELEEKMSDIEERVSKHFKLELSELLMEYDNDEHSDADEKEYRRLAMNIVRRCPSHIEKIFLMDSIKQTFGKDE